MKRILPYPFFAAILLLAWLLLNESVSPGAVVFGAIVAVVISWIMVSLEVPRTILRRPLAAIRLAFAVLVEIVRSNNAVARIILSSNKRDRRSGFVRIPLDTRNPYSLAALACIITATPGTLWVEYDSVDNTMLLHVLDLIDEEEWVRIIKERYESRLMEIFS
jgi:multicomponent K+:H+ antiporter subunit E